MFSRLAQNLGSGVHPLTSWISSSDIHGENILPILLPGGTNKHIAAVAANNLSKAYFLFLFLFLYQVSTLFMGIFLMHFCGVTNTKSALLCKDTSKVPYRSE